MKICKLVHLNVMGKSWVVRYLIDWITTHSLLGTADHYYALKMAKGTVGEEERRLIFI